MQRFIFLFAAVLVTCLLSLLPAEAAVYVAVPAGLGSLVYLRGALGECKTLPFTNATGGDLAQGAWVNVNGTYGPLLEATPDGEEGVIITETPSQGYEAAKDAVAIGEGEPAYLITATSLVTNADGAGANPRVGYFAESATAGTERVRTVIQQ